MIVSTKERIRSYQFMQHDERVRFDLSTWVAEEIEERFGLDLFAPRSWSPLAIDATEWGADLASFAERVKRVAAVLGPAKEVTTQNWLATDVSPPDLVAKWVVPLDRFPDSLSFAKAARIVYGGPIRPASEVYPMVEIVVRVSSPKGCKVDPRTAYVAEQRPELHPECKAVLRELEEAGDVPFFQRARELDSILLEANKEVAG